MNSGGHSLFDHILSLNKIHLQIIYISIRTRILPQIRVLISILRSFIRISKILLIKIIRLLLHIPILILRPIIFLLTLQNLRHNIPSILLLQSRIKIPFLFLIINIHYKIKNLSK